MIKKCFLCAAIGLFNLAIYGYAEEIAVNPDFEKNKEFFVYEGLVFNLGDSVSEIINNMGIPKETKITQTKNTHAPETMDEIHKLYYDGLFVQVLVTAEKDIVEKISVTSADYKIIWGLGIGSSIDHVKNILGHPSKEYADVVYVYICKFCGYDDNVVFYFRDGVTYRIDWDFYID